MYRHEYAELLLKLIPEKIISQYGLRGIEHNGYIYEVRRKGMYDLQQDGRISNYYLKNNLEPHGHHQCRHTAVL